MSAVDAQSRSTSPRSSRAASLFAARFSRVMSREIARIFSGLPVASRIGETRTSHHLGFPFNVSVMPWNCPLPPACAAATAALASAFSVPCQKSGHGHPRTASKSATSMTRFPPSLMKTSFASRSRILMQSSDAARTLFMKSWSMRRFSASSRFAVSSRTIFRKPIGDPLPSRSSIIFPLAQNRRPSLRTCHRSSLPRPASST